MKTSTQTLSYEKDDDYKMSFESVVINNHWRKRARKLRNRKWREVNRKAADASKDNYDTTFYKGWKYE